MKKLIQSSEQIQVVRKKKIEAKENDENENQEKNQRKN